MLFLALLASACSKTDNLEGSEQQAETGPSKQASIRVSQQIENKLPFEKLLTPLDEDEFTGDYWVKQITPSIFGYDTFDPDGGGVMLTLFNDAMASGITAEAVKLNEMQRAFDAVYLAELGFDIPTTFIIEFFSERAYFPYEEYTGLACGGENITLGFPLGATGRFDVANDSIFTLRFLDDVTNSCSGQQVDVELLFTKL